MVKRAKLEIMRDILLIIKNNKGRMKPTPLLRRSGLSSTGFKEYYSYLITRELVRIGSDNDLNKQVILTDKGYKFIERYITIIDFIEEFDL